MNPFLGLLTLAVFDPQSALEPGGPGAQAIKSLGVFFFVLLGLIFLAVVTIGMAAVLRTRPGEATPAKAPPNPPRHVEDWLARLTGGAIAVTIALLFLLVVLSVLTGKETAAPPRGKSLVVEITGHQWWWDIQYTYDDVSLNVSTPNELHIPVGQTVLIRGTSRDVIHSFWVPNLQGKRDLIPSHITTSWVQASRPGRFRGQCGEFCGTQHAHMAFWVVAEPPESFEAWIVHQRGPAPDPSDSVRSRGREVFLRSACILCHTIRGTDAAGRIGPDLTHVSSRLTIAAGTLAMTRDNLANWIADPQKAKPGNHMAVVPIPGEDFQPLIEYMVSLQ